MTNIHANESEKKTNQNKSNERQQLKNTQRCSSTEQKKVDENVWEKKKQICTAITEIVYNVIAATCYNRR